MHCAEKIWRGQLLRLAALTSVCIESEENSAHRPGLNSFLFIHSNLFDESVFQQQTLIYKRLIAELRLTEEWLLSRISFYPPCSASPLPVAPLPECEKNNAPFQIQMANHSSSDFLVALHIQSTSRSSSCDSRQLRHFITRLTSF